MFMSRVRIFAALVAAASVAAPVAATAQDEEAETQTAEESRTDTAIAFAQELTTQANDALTQDGASEAEKLDAFRGVLSDGLALETIGKFMLGDARKNLTDEQSERYNAVFPVYITKLYAEQFEEIIGKPLEVIDSKEIGSRDVIVRTQFERDGESPVLVDWRIRKLRSGEHKAIDIIVQGVSIMLVKREEFSSFVASNGVDALIDRLESEAAV